MENTLKMETQPAAITTSSSVANGCTSETQPQVAEAWTISFGAPSRSRRKVTAKERAAMTRCTRSQLRADGNDVVAADSDAGPAPVPDVNGDAFIDLAVAIPRNLTTTREDIAARTHFDVARLLCMTKQYRGTCGISSLCSVWNHLYSRLGCGALPPVSQEEMMSILGFQPPFGDIRWGPFTGNTTLMRWFHAINRHFGVTGKAFFLWKAHGQGRTVGITAGDAKARLKDALRSPHAGVIYHCKNHYFVPIGFQEQPRAQIHCYAPALDEDVETETHLFIGEVSRGRHSAMHVVRWADVVTDIECQAPHFFNIRQREKGVQRRERCVRPGGNLHCLMCFRSDVAEQHMELFEEGGGADEEQDDEEAEDELAPAASAQAED